MRGGDKEDPARLRERVLRTLRRAGAPYSGLAELPALEAEDVGLLLTAARTAKDFRDRAQALRGVANQATEEQLMRVLGPALASPHAGWRQAALDVVVEQRLVGAVPMLLDGLEAAVDRGGRGVADVSGVLMRLTGQQFGRRLEIWRRWWSEFGQTWLEAARHGRAAAPVESAAPGETVAEVFGIPVESTRVALVVDGSGSMVMSQWGELTCAEAAAQELDKFLGRLPDGALFNVFLVTRETVPLFEDALEVRKKTRAEALRFLRRHSYRAASALYDSLVEVQNLPDVDTIVYIGDGGLELRKPSERAPDVGWLVAGVSTDGRPDPCDLRGARSAEGALPGEAGGGNGR